MKGLSLTLETVSKTIPAGTIPAFRLTIQNDGTVAEKVLKPRGDLHDTYYDLQGTRDGKPVNLPRAISDPGPVTEDDFVSLEPGKNVTFEFTRFATGLHYLAPGTYEARIRVWQDPFLSWASAVLSPAAEFTVQE